MRIAICLEWCDPASGGQAIWGMGLARHLVARGHEVHVVAQDAWSAAASAGWPAAPHTVAYTWSPLLRAYRYAACLKAIDPDVVHDSGVTIWRGVFQPQTGSALGGYDADMASQPWYRRVRTALLPRYHFLRASMAVLERLQVRRAHRVIAISPKVLALLSRRQPRLSHKMELVFNAVDQVKLAPSTLKELRPAMRKALHHGRSPILLFAAHNFRLKGLDVAIKALGRLKARGLKPLLVTAGGATSAYWDALASKAGVSNQIRHLGRVDDMRPLYAAADILVHPTRWDACSLVVLEAIAARIPVITTRDNGASVMIDEGALGYVIGRATDLDALVGHLETLLIQVDQSERDDANAPTASNAALSASYDAIESALITAAKANKRETVSG